MAQKQTKNLQHPPQGDKQPGSRLWACSAFLLGTLLVWSFLAPMDSNSVFEGSAIPQNLFWLVLAVITAAAAIISGRSYRFGPSQWSLAGGCLVWLILVALLAGRENNPRIAWNGFWQMMSMASCYFSAQALIVGPKSRAAIIQILIVGCVALSLHGLYQAFVEIPQFQARYLADPDAFLAEVPDVDAPEGSPSRRRFEDRLFSPEPYATFALANSLAAVLSGGLVLLLCQVIDALRGNVADLRKHALAAGCVAVALVAMLVCWLLARSRIAYGALLIGLIYWYLANGKLLRGNRRRMRWLMMAGGLAIPVGLVWLVQNDSLVLSEAPKSLAYRLEYWFATLQMLKQHWLFGVGLGNFQGYYPIYKLPAASETVADPHNWILDICVNLSIPIGMVIVGWILRTLFFSESRPDVDEHKTAPNSDSGDAAGAGRFLSLGGAIGGGICAVLLYLLDGQNLLTLTLTWLPAILLMVLGRSLWIHGLCTPTTARAAALTMLTCLLISGSWQASGLAMPILVILSLTWTNLQTDRIESNIPGLKRWAPCLVPALGLSVFLFQCWRPCTSSWSLLQQVERAGSLQQQLNLVGAAAAADPLDTRPLQWQAQIKTSLALTASKDLFSPLAEEAVVDFDHWLSRDSVKSLNWELAGRHALELAAKADKFGTDTGKLLKDSVRYYTQAVARYPSSVGLRAQLAVVLAINNQWLAAAQECQTALELSRQTPHFDKQLGRQQLWLPLLPEEAASEFAAQGPTMAAEPVLNWLRNKTMSEAD